MARFIVWDGEEGKGSGRVSDEYFTADAAEAAVEEVASAILNDGCCDGDVSGKYVFCAQHVDGGDVERFEVLAEYSTEILCTVDEIWP